MVEVEFYHNRDKIKIKANMDDSFELIINKYINKTNLDINNIYFLYNGKNFNNNVLIKNIMNESDKQNNKMIILVYSINKTIKNNYIKSKDIICPECKEICKYEIKNYRIKLYDCKNGHIKENIQLNEFNNTQNIDISDIICDNCKHNNMLNTYNNEFYKCNECNVNLCPLCKSIHDKTHMIINYDNKNYICNKHNETFVKYCDDCKKDICLYCINEHSNHNILLYEDKLIDIKRIRRKMDDLRIDINKFKDNLEKIVIKLKTIINNMEIYYNINNNIIQKYEINKNKNYNLLYNLNHINEIIEKERHKITFNYNYGNNLNQMLYLYNEIMDENKEIEMKYQPKDDNKDKIRIFNNIFINNNIYKCRIIYNNEEYDLKEYFQDIDSKYNNKDGIKFKLKGINNITSIGSIFMGCNCLTSLPDISKWNASNVTDISGIFYGCKSLTSLPDISKWNTHNVTDMNSIFYGCNSLTSLPDISKWNTSNVTNMNGIFYECNSLTSYLIYQNGILPMLLI